MTPVPLRKVFKCSTLRLHKHSKNKDAGYSSFSLGSHIQQHYGVWLWGLVVIQPQEHE